MPSDERTHIDGDEILERFAHLQTLDVKMTCVQEIVHPLPAVMVRLHQ